MFNIGGKRFDAKHSNAHTPHCKLILKTGRVIPHVAIQSRTARMKHYEKHCSVLPSEVQTGEMHYSNRGPSQSPLELAGQSRPLKAAELKFSDLKLSNCNCNFPSSIPMLGYLEFVVLVQLIHLATLHLAGVVHSFCTPADIHGINCEDDAAQNKCNVPFQGLKTVRATNTEDENRKMCVTCRYTSLI